MNRYKVLDIVCGIVIFLIIGIVGFAFYIIFLPENSENSGFAELGNVGFHFDLNGADYIDKKDIDCLSMDDCVITLPVATRKNGVVLGYDTSAVSVNPKYKIGDSYQVGNDDILYVISYVEKKITIDKGDVDYLEENVISCKAFNKEESCIIHVPSFNKIGYENRGYSTSANSLVGFVFPNENYRVSKNITLYPIYGTNNRLVNLKIDKVLTYNGSIIEIEKGCGDDIYNEYLKYIEQIEENAPFLLLGNKISFVSDDSFDNIWGEQYVGMNYGPYSGRSLDIRCSYRVYNDYYGTMVHEMSHSWDFFYGTRTQNNLSSQNDIINLFNKYNNLPDRPFRDYSYSSIYEFLADSLKYYYFKYLVPVRGYKELSYPNDLKEVLEKYICIAKNDYNEEGCE